MSLPIHCELETPSSRRSFVSTARHYDFRWEILVRPAAPRSVPGAPLLPLPSSRLLPRARTTQAPPARPEAVQAGRRADRPRPIDRPKTETALRGLSAIIIHASGSSVRVRPRVRPSAASVSSFPIHPDYSQGRAGHPILPPRLQTKQPLFPIICSMRPMCEPVSEPSQRNLEAKGLGTQIWAK